MRSCTVQAALILSLPACDSPRSVALDESTCAACEIIVERVATLNFADAPGSIDLYPSVVRTARGYLVAGVVPRYQLFEFDSSGAFIGPHGVYGSGPTEFRGVVNVAAVGDSVWVFDQGNMRCAVSDLNVQPARTFPCAGYFSNVLPYFAGVVAQGPPATPEHVGYHLRIVSPMGEVQSFAETDSIYDLADPGIYRRPIAVAGDGVWLGRADDYELQLWHPDAGFLRSLRRTPPWLDPGGFVTVPEGFSPRPMFLSLHAEGDSLLWVSAAVFQSEPPRFERGLDPFAWYPHMASVIEVIESRTGDLIATTALEDADMLRPVDHGLWAAIREDADIGMIDIYRLQLQRNR